MRAVSLAAGRAPGFTAGGTAEVILVGLAIGVPASFIFVVVRRYLPGPPWLKGGSFGALVFLALVLVPPPAAQSAATAAGDLPLTLALFGALFVAYGLAIAASLKWQLRE